MTLDTARLQRLLGGDELAGLRQRLRARFRRAAPTESFTLTSLTPTQRQTLEGLLGRTASSAGSMRLSQQALDQALSRAGIAPSLHAALEALDGPLQTHAERQQILQAWVTTAAGSRDARMRALLARPAGLGLLKRFAGHPERAIPLLDKAERVLARLPAQGLPLAQLAAETLGDAHALDAGSVGLAALVLRAAETSLEWREDEAADAAAQSGDETRLRNRWARLGVVVSELAAPVLCLNLDAEIDSLGGRLLACARTAGEPLHLSLGLLLRAPPRWRVADRAVFVCENPTILAIAARRLGGACAPLVCTDGMPAAAQRSLLDQLASSGAHLRYHGDFDWPGITIGNFVMRRFGADPWRFGVKDYCPDMHMRTLAGNTVAADWDPALAPRMAQENRALDEEAVAAILLADLESK